MTAYVVTTMERPRLARGLRTLTTSEATISPRIRGNGLAVETVETDVADMRGILNGR